MKKTIEKESIKREDDDDSDSSSSSEENSSTKAIGKQTPGPATKPSSNGAQQTTKKSGKR